MANVLPFRGLRYALSQIPIAKVVTQPYDKISKEMQDRYYELHSNNLIRIILGRVAAEDSSDNNVYTRAAATLKEWRNSGVIEKMGSPAFFAYFQRFVIPGTRDIQVRKGFVGRARLEDYANHVVFPHERTLSGPKRDRLELLRHTRTHFEQIFMLYEDPSLAIDRKLDEASAGAPDIQVEDEYGVTHTFWTLADPASIRFIEDAMSARRLVIADGHHRYETALAYRDERRAASSTPEPGAPFEYMPMAFFNMDSPGLTILPTHRVVTNVAGFDSNLLLQRAGKFFDVIPAPSSPDDVRAALTKVGKDRLTLAACIDGGNRTVLLALKPDLDLGEAMPDLSEKQRLLDVVILHRLLIEKCLGITEEAVKHESNITYVREMDKAIETVRKGDAQVAFLLNATGLHQMCDVAYEGNVMPQKSTDFYPKVLSGLMMYCLEDEQAALPEASHQGKDQR